MVTEQAQHTLDSAIPPVCTICGDVDMRLSFGLIFHFPPTPPMQGPLDSIGQNEPSLTLVRSKLVESLSAGIVTRGGAHRGSDANQTLHML